MPLPGETQQAPSGRESRAAARRKQESRAQELLGLFAWHKDPPLVAKALKLSLDELQAELHELGIKRKALRLARSSAAAVPRALPLPGVPSGPPVRRRARRDRAPAVTSGALEVVHEAEPPHTSGERVASAADEVAAQAARLKALLGEIGPRRRELARRLGTPGRPLGTRVLLARFRAAGLERELGQRERDLLRALFARHRGGERKVAEDLDLSHEELGELVRERGLVREVEALRERYRREIRQAAWPAAQLSNLALRRGWLEDLGVYSELRTAARERAASAWEKARRARDPMPALRRELHIGPAESRFLRDLFSS